MSGLTAHTASEFASYLNPLIRWEYALKVSFDESKDLPVGAVVRGALPFSDLVGLGAVLMVFPGLASSFATSLPIRKDLSFGDALAISSSSSGLVPKYLTILGPCLLAAKIKSCISVAS